jgi:hypothetical protein
MTVWDKKNNAPATEIRLREAIRYQGAVYSFFARAASTLASANI